jgi:hypothetical protein
MSQKRCDKKIKSKVAVSMNLGSTELPRPLAGKYAVIVQGPFSLTVPNL